MNENLENIIIVYKEDNGVYEIEIWKHILILVKFSLVNYLVVVENSDTLVLNSASS